MRICHLAAVLVLAVVLVLIVILILVLVAVTVLAVVLILVLVAAAVLAVVLVLVIHGLFLQILSCGRSAPLACPVLYDLSFALKIRLASNPANTAAVMPPAAAFRPPVKIPRNPS